MRNQFYTDLDNDLFFASEDELAITVYARFNYLLKHYEENDPGSTLASRIKDARRDIMTTIGFFKPNRISDNDTYRDESELRAFKKWLEKKSPKQYQEYKRGENFYGFKSRKVESMLKSSSPYWKKHSSYPDFNL